jgi:hypothetical protein
MRQEQGLDLATARQAMLVASRVLTASFKD